MPITPDKIPVAQIGNVAALALVCLSPLALAQQEDAQGAVSVHYGIGDHYQRLSVTYDAPFWWTTQFSESWGRLHLTGEFGVAYWKADGSRSPSDVWQFNAIPMFRRWTGERFYVEAGTLQPLMIRGRLIVPGCA